MIEPTETETTVLTPECGHHCGKKDGYVGHCPCRECHGVGNPHWGLAWHYGPTDNDPDPGKMWHYDCGGEVWIIDGGYYCRKCEQASL